MGVHLSGLEIAPALPAQSGQFLVRPLAAGFQVQIAAIAHDGTRRLQRRGIPVGIEGRIEQQQVDAGGTTCQFAQHGQRIALAYLHGVGIQQGFQVAQLAHQRRMLLQQQHAGSSARCRLQPQRAGAGAQVDTVPAAQILAQPVEQGFAHTVWRGTQAGRNTRAGRHRQQAPAPCATDNADLPRNTHRSTSSGLPLARGCRPCGCP